MRSNIVKRHPDRGQAAAAFLFRAARRASLLLVLIAVTFAISACASWGKRESGAVVGAVGGGAVGAVVGNQTGSTARGAIIGAVVGGTAGAIIGHQMDQQAKQLEQNIPGAVVQRVGEGIQVTFASGLLYDFDSSTIRDEAARNLRSLAESLGQYANTELLIVGHTDAAGSEVYNQNLSGRRAQAAVDYLASRGVSAGRMHGSGRGELEPLATNETEAGRQANRRIEVAIFASKAARAGK
jgi:outer membrane protein OmpA-like peptidoglycan-associated protein